MHEDEREQLDYLEPIDLTAKIGSLLTELDSVVDGRTIEAQIVWDIIEILQVLESRLEEL